MQKVGGNKTASVSAIRARRTNMYAIGALHRSSWTGAGLAKTFDDKAWGVEDPTHVIRDIDASAGMTNFLCSDAAKDLNLDAWCDDNEDQRILYIVPIDRLRTFAPNADASIRRARYHEKTDGSPIRYIVGF